MHWPYTDDVMCLKNLYWFKKYSFWRILAKFLQQGKSGNVLLTECSVKNTNFFTSREIEIISQTLCESFGCTNKYSYPTHSLGFTSTSKSTSYFMRILTTSTCPFCEAAWRAVCPAYTPFTWSKHPTSPNYKPSMKQTTSIHLPITLNWMKQQW